ncbi:acetyltransferase (GNAT) family protein [mine drainage metagenome]|uniref:Acetyltransferase (GNAT) family protein n=1 Tax=mine drainage metagenome TaxID=410659 RepID=A0A1J5Q441_9ZZZZ
MIYARPMSIREALPQDVNSIHGLIIELAEYERAAHEVIATPEDLMSAFFAPTPHVNAHVAVDDATGEVVGFALWFINYSTWLGRHGIYLEDLYVKQTSRGQGHGRVLLATLAGICVERGYGRLEWSVLDWNEPAINFYRQLGAISMDEWTVNRATGQALKALAEIR